MKAVITITFLLFGFQHFAQIRAEAYFPADFEPTSYVKFLQAMKEPSMYARRNDKNFEAYRFLWLRSFHDPIAVRVEKIQDQIRVTSVRLKAEGSRPGKILYHTVTNLPTGSWEVVTNLTKNAGFFEMPSRDTNRALDGGRWILEGVGGGNYHIVDRWSPSLETSERQLQPYLDACLHFLKVGGIDMSKEKVY